MRGLGLAAREGQGLLRQRLFAAVRHLVELQGRGWLRLRVLLRVRVGVHCVGVRLGRVVMVVVVLLGGRLDQRQVQIEEDVMRPLVAVGDCKCRHVRRRRLRKGVLRLLQGVLLRDRASVDEIADPAGIDMGVRPASVAPLQTRLVPELASLHGLEQRVVLRDG